MVNHARFMICPPTLARSASQVPSGAMSGRFAISELPILDQSSLQRGGCPARDRPKTGFLDAPEGKRRSRFGHMQDRRHFRFRTGTIMHLVS
jgi:hypothetical protein